MIRTSRIAIMKVQCCPNVFVSNLESINEFVEVLESNDVSFLIDYPALIVSIGCEAVVKTLTSESNDYPCSSPSTTILTYSDVLDDPKYCLIPLWHDVLPIMHRTVTEGGSVIVHCVHGQSRSVSTVVAYMVLMGGFALNEAVKQIKEVHGNICINPGFLAQLYFISTARQDSAAYRLMLDYYRPYMAQARRKIIYWREKTCFKVSHPTPCIITADNPSHYILCKKCKSSLGVSKANIMELCWDARTFVDTEVDAYWRDYWVGRMSSQYGKSSKRPVVLPHKQFIALYPVEWMRDQRRALSNSSEKCELVCPSCRALVGGWTENGVDICLGSCLSVDLYYFDKSLVRIAR